MIEKYETPEYQVVDIAKLKVEVEQLKTNLAAANNIIAQLVNALELKVDKADIINQINISSEGVLIDGKKIHITAHTLVDAAEITSGTINADKVVGKTFRDIAFKE